MTRRLAVVAIALACVVATPALAARHHEAPRASSAVTQFCGDRYCPAGVIANNPTRQIKRAAPVLRRVAKRHPADDRAVIGGHGLVDVGTAAGIDITVAPAFAPKITGFIRDLVAEGYMPKRIHCFSLSRSHVPGSLHFTGNACDFNQRGWGKTDRPMYRVAALAKKWGLRDGCSFGDCGHIDAGGQLARAPWPRVLRLAHR